MSNYPPGYNEPEDLDHYLDRIEEENKRLRAQLDRYRAALGKVMSAGVEPFLDDRQAADKMYEIAKQALEEK